MFALCLRAPNDRNGNPRRVWLAYSANHRNPAVPTYVLDEGYGGRSGIADDLVRIDGVRKLQADASTIRYAIANAPVFDVPAAQYRAYAKGISPNA